MDAGIDPEHNEQGFTLIELVVVVAVLSVLTIGAGLALGRSNSSGDSDLVWFQRQFEQARIASVLRQEWQGLSVTQQGMSTARRSAGAWNTSDVLRRWQGRVSIATHNTIQYESGGPDVLFLPNGQSTAFTVQFADRLGRGVRRCRSDGWTGLICDES